MMKILHLISGGDVGGAKTHVLSLVKELQKTEQVKMICFMEGVFFDEAKSMGIDITVLKQKNRFDLSVVKQIIAIIQTEGIDIIHSHGARANFITYFIAKKIKTPSVTTVHSDFMLDFKGNLYKHLIFTTLNVWALKRFDYYIAVSQDFKNMLINRRFPADKIMTVYNGLDFHEEVSFMSREEFLEKAGLKRLQDKLLVGILARLHPVKGHKVFIDAAAAALKQKNDVHFLIAGDGEEHKGLEEYAAKLGIHQNLHFLGHINDIYGFLNSIDINVLTSYSESFPYVLLEGAKLKKPTIASAVGGIPVLILDGQCGYLFKAGDADELKDKMLKLLESEEQRIQFGEALYQHARENFSLENLAKEHIKIYGVMLGGTKDENY